MSKKRKEKKEMMKLFHSLFVLPPKREWGWVIGSSKPALWWVDDTSAGRPSLPHTHLLTRLLGT